jgi:beta-N-acetylhexosaminidase
MLVGGVTNRRRRLIRTLAAGGTIVATGLVLALVASGSSGGGSPRYVPPGGPASVIAAPAAPASPTRISPPPAFKPDPAAVALASRLPLDQQVAQLFLVSVDGTSTRAASALGSTAWGGVVLDNSNFAAERQLGALTRALTAAARGAGSIRPLLAATQEGGPQTAFPSLPPQGEAAIGAAGRPELAQTEAQLAGTRLRALGVMMTLAPLADVDTAGGALSGRLYSTDPAAVTNLTVAALRGYARARLIAAVGHFPGSGGASADPDQTPATVGGTLTALRARDLVPFAAVATLAPVFLMSNAAYAALDGVTPASLSPKAVTLLRRTLGFPGVVMSDDLDATLPAIGAGPGTAAVQALQAGDDLLYITGPPSERGAAYQAVLTAAQRSTASRALVHEALLRVLTLKARYRALR